MAIRKNKWEAEEDGKNIKMEHDFSLFLVISFFKKLHLKLPVISVFKILFFLLDILILEYMNDDPFNVTDSVESMNEQVFITSLSVVPLQTKV